MRIETRPLRGRAEELAVADEALRRVAAGSSAMLTFEGPPGIGKSALLKEIGRRAGMLGFRSLAVRAFEDTLMVPFAPLFELVLRAEPPLCDARELRELASRADSQFWIVGDLAAAVAAAGAATPLCIAVDDLHWADPATVLALRTLVVTDAPILWIFATRPTGGNPVTSDAVKALVRVGAQWSRERVLGGLGLDAVADIAGDVLRAEVDESVLRLSALANGNPFLVLELLSGLGEEDRIRVERGRARATGAAPPQRLATTMQRRLDRLSPDAGHAVQVASVLPVRFSAAMLAKALGRSPSQIMGVVDEAIRADLLTESGEHLRFRHDLLRTAAQQTIPYGLRRAMERESAAIMLELGAAPEEVAAQLVRSADVGDVTAAGSLRDAADALARTSPTGAADLSLRALQLLRPDDPLRSEMLTDTVMKLNQALRYDEARHLTASSLTTPLTGEQEAAIRLIESIVSREAPGRRVDENRRALVLPGISPQMRTRHLAWLAFNLAGDGHVAAAREAVRDAMSAVDEHDDVQARTIAQCALVRVDCAEGRGRESLDRLVMLQPTPSSPDFGLLGAIVAFEVTSSLVTMGCSEEALGKLTVALEHSRGIHAAEQVLALVRGQCDVVAGRLDAARRTVEEAFAEDDCLDIARYGGIGFTVLAAVAAHTADRVLTRDVGIAARASLAGGPSARREAICALARTAWQRGDDAAAARWLGEEVQLLTSPLWAADLDDVVLAARVAATSSDAGLRERVMVALETLERGGRQDTLFSAVAVHVRALVDGDAAALDQAAARLAAMGRPILHAGAVEDSGVALMAGGHRSSAAARWAEAFDLYVDLGCTADAQRVARYLSSVGVQRRVVRRRARSGWESLTESEMRVLEVVADGATNRQAADRLGVSPHTVNAHLRKVFAKLGVHSRAELVARARGTDPWSRT